MPLLLEWSLQRKLVAISLLVLLPLVLFSYYLVQENVARTKLQILSSSAATADIIAFQVDDFIQSTQKLLETLAKLQDVRDRKSWETSRILMDAVTVHEDFRIIFATQEDGSIFATGITEGMLHDNVARNEYLVDAIKRGGVTVSGRLPSMVGDWPIVNIIVALKDNSEQTVGAVGAGVSLTNLQRRLTSSQIQSRGATVILVDIAGTALVHPDWTYVNNPTWLGSLPPVQAGLSREDKGTIEYVDPVDHDTYLAAYARAKAANWIVVVAYPADLVYSPVQEATLRGLVGLAMTAIITALIGLFFTARFTHPLSELSKRSREVMDTFMGTRSEPVERDEVRQLASAIDVMSSSLTHHADELARSRREIDEKAQQLRDLSAKAVHVQEEERRRLALDVHDGVAQLISGALHQTQAAGEFMASNPEAAMRRLNATEKLLDQAVAEVKRVMAELRPTGLEGGLVGAIQRTLSALQDTFGIQCQLSVDGTSAGLTGDEEVAAFRIVQEAVNNIRKHAEASRVDVTVESRPSFVRITVEDNGRGFNPDAAVASGSGGLGLVGMRERASFLGASLDIHSTLGKGTIVLLELPVARAQSVLAQLPASDTATKKG